MFLLPDRPVSVTAQGSINRWKVIRAAIRNQPIRNTFCKIHLVFLFSWEQSIDDNIHLFAFAIFVKRMKSPPYVFVSFLFCDNLLHLNVRHNMEETICLKFQSPFTHAHVLLFVFFFILNHHAALFHTTGVHRLSSKTISLSENQDKFELAIHDKHPLYCSFKILFFILHIHTGLPMLSMMVWTHNVWL